MSSVYGGSRRVRVQAIPYIRNQPLASKFSADAWNNHTWNNEVTNFLFTISEEESLIKLQNETDGSGLPAISLTYDKNSAGLELNLDGVTNLVFEFINFDHPGFEELVHNPFVLAVTLTDINGVIASTEMRMAFNTNTSCFKTTGIKAIYDYSSVQGEGYNASALGVCAILDRVKFQVPLTELTNFSNFNIYNVKSINAKIVAGFHSDLELDSLYFECPLTTMVMSPENQKQPACWKW